MPLIFSRQIEVYGTREEWEMSLKATEGLLFHPTCGARSSVGPKEDKSKAASSQEELVRDQRAGLKSRSVGIHGS